PSSGFQTPSAILTVVLLPEPFGPISVTISSRRTERSTPRTSQRPPRWMPALTSSTRFSESRSAACISSFTCLSRPIAHVIALRNCLLCYYIWRGDEEPASSRNLFCGRLVSCEYCKRDGRCCCFHQAHSFACCWRDGRGGATRSSGARQCLPARIFPSSIRCSQAGAGQGRVPGRQRSGTISGKAPSIAVLQCQDRKSVRSTGSGIAGSARGRSLRGA